MDKRIQLHGIAMHLFQLFLLLLILDAGQQLADRRDNHAQRSFQVVGEIRKELHLSLRLLQDFLFFQTLQFQTVLHTKEVHCPEYQDKAQQDINGLCPRGVVPGRNDVDVQCIRLFGRLAMRIQLTHYQAVVTVVQIVVSNPVRIRFQQVPFTVHTFQAIQQFAFLFKGIRQVGKFKSKIVLVVVQIYTL